MARYRVHLVVDRDLAEGLKNLPAAEPIWVVDSPGNQRVILELRGSQPDQNRLTRITAFRDNASAAPEDLAVRVLGDIDLHHGECSHDPPYDCLRVIGARRSEEILTAAEQCGLTMVRGDDSDFEVYRPSAEPSTPANTAPPGRFE